MAKFDLKIANKRKHLRNQKKNFFFEIAYKNHEDGRRSGKSRKKGNFKMLKFDQGASYGVTRKNVLL